MTTNNHYIHKIYPGADRLVLNSKILNTAHPLCPLVSGEPYPSTPKQINQKSEYTIENYREANKHCEVRIKHAFKHNTTHCNLSQLLALKQNNLELCLSPNKMPVVPNTNKSSFLSKVVIVHQNQNSSDRTIDKYRTIDKCREAALNI